MTPEELAEHVRREVDQAPLLSSAKKAELALIIGPIKRTKKAA